MNQKGFANIVLIILIVALAGATGYFVLRQPAISPSEPSPTSQTPPTTNDNITPQTNISNDPTANWKNYRNEKYGFEIRFPHDWSFFERNKDYPDVVTILEFVPVPEDMPWGDSFIGYLNLHKDVKDFSGWFNQEAKFGAARTQRMLEAANNAYGDGFLKKEDFSSEYRSTTINGFPAIVQTIKIVRCPNDDNSACYFLGGPKSYEEDWFIFKQGSVIEIGVQTYSSPVNKFDQIISTFKFVQ